MREPILMPSLSDTMESGQLVEWLKQPGDAVKKGEVLAEVETDKAVMDLEGFYDGYMAGPLAVAESEQPVGAVIGYIVDSAEKDKEETAGVEKKTAATQPASVTKKETEKNTQHSVADTARPFVAQPTQLAKATDFSFRWVSIFLITTGSSIILR